MDTKNSSTSIAEKRRSVRKTYRQHHIRRMFCCRMRNINTRIMFFLRITALSTASIWLERCRKRGEKYHFLGSRPMVFSKCASVESFSLQRQYSMQARNWLKIFIINHGWIANLSHCYIPFLRRCVCTRMVKTKNDGWKRLQYTRPTIIPIYNRGLGGADSGDQRMEAYWPELKTFSWVPCVLTHFINLAILNSFIWYSAAFPERKLSPNQFRERLVDDLVTSHLDKQVKEDGVIFPRSLSTKTKTVQGAMQVSRFSLASPLEETSR